MESRRNFIAKSAIAFGGLALGLSPRSYAKVIGANSRVNVALVGFSLRAKYTLAPGLLQHAKELNFDLIGVSDIWNLRRDEGVAYIKEKTGKSKVLAARNNEELYGMKEVDAVIISTADFQHALHGVEAVKAGRDAYIEKPLANTIEDAKAILEAVKSTNKIVQIGTQRRSGENYQIANEYIRSGKFGNILSVELMWNVNQPGRWRLPDLVAKCKEQDTDWKRFLMNRPYEPFDPRKYCEYRLFWPYSSGIPCQWMVHQIDTVHWFTGLPRPRSVVANGGLYHWQDGRTNFDTMTAVFDYGPLDTNKGGFQVVYSSRMHNSAGGTKELYYSNGGMLNLDTNKVSADGGLDEKAAKVMGLQPNLLDEFSLAPPTKVETAANTGADPMSSAHVRNWMECVRSRKSPNADIEAGYNHSVALCMTIAALHTGKRVTFDDAKQQVVVN
jgi:predicted dehydrogenase